MQKRKARVTRDQFRDRYESGLVPLAIAERKHLRRYVRNYFSPIRGLPAPDWDVVTAF